MSERSTVILEILNRKKKVGVGELAQLLDVSQVTVRKDLSELEAGGLVVREHGAAILADTNDVGGRIALRYDAKKRIARRAAELVRNGDTIMVESGSCCALFVEELAAEKHGLTVITNNCFIPDYVRGRSDICFNLLGGLYQQDSQTLVGPMVKTCVSAFWVNRFFIGIDGYAPESGFCNRDLLRAQAVNDMARQAKEVVVMSTSDKFLSRSTVPLALDNVSTVITDAGITPASERALRDAGITVITVA